MKISWYPRPKRDRTKWHAIFAWRPRVWREDGPWGYGKYNFAWLTKVERRWQSFDYDSLLLRGGVVATGVWHYREYVGSFD